MRSTKIELLPCPFCGAKETELEIGYINATTYGIECGCGCSMSEKMYNHYSDEANKEMDDFEATGLTTSQAIFTFHVLNVCEKWNRRE